MTFNNSQFFLNETKSLRRFAVEILLAVAISLAGVLKLTFVGMCRWSISVFNIIVFNVFFNCHFKKFAYKI